jgi:hypothetical protein
MILVGCDLPTRKQQVALLNTATGELRDQELSHIGDDVERFYAALSPPSPSASRAPATPCGSTRSCSALAIRSSSARPQRSERWSCAKSRPIAAMRGTSGIS